MSEKYPNGYWPKIEYWTGKLKDEVANTKVPDLKVIDSIHRKLDFFIIIQIGLYNIWLR